MFLFDHLALYVRDLDVSARFYQDVFKLKPIPNPFSGGKFWLEIPGGQQLHLIKNEDKSQTIPERSHFCFSTSDLSAFIDSLDVLAIVWSDFDGNEGRIRLRSDGVQQIYFQDPDGYWIEVNDALPALPY